MKTTVYIHAKYNEYNKEFAFEAFPFDATYRPGSTCIGTQEIEFDPPPHDVLVNGTIKLYREEQKRILAEAEAKRANLERRINELLCIEYKREAA